MVHEKLGKDKRIAQLEAELAALRRDCSTGMRRRVTEQRHEIARLHKVVMATNKMECARGGADASCYLDCVPAEEWCAPCMAWRFLEQEGD